MRRPIRMSVMLALTGVLTSVLTLVPTGTASAAESIPTLKWPAVTIGQIAGTPVTSPNGDVTIPCDHNGVGSDLITYSAAGKVVRKISRTAVVDGVPNCITFPVADKNGVIYGQPYGKVGSSWRYGANLVAYRGNTLKWKYPLTCGTSEAPSYEVGANGNIYSTSRMSDGSVHLIGLTPEVAVGKTQPTKILDLKIQTDCTTVLRTYKDGIVLHAQTGGHARYYSYSGKFLGEAAIGTLWDEKVDADGRLFVSSLVSGSYTSARISRYDPSTGTVRWATSVSTSGASVRDITLSPLPGGGVAALIAEQKMISGIPTLPTVWVKTLVVVNANGQKVRSRELPATYAGGKFGNSYLTSENGGKVVVVRELAVNTGLSYPTTVPGIAVQTYDPASNTWPYSKSIIGDIAKSGGPSGYMLESADLVASLPVNNTLYVRAACTNNCDGGKKLFAVAVTGMGVEYPRGAVLNRTARASVSYVALGDSFSSGEGVPPFETATSKPGVNTCHRSTTAYARLIAGTSSKIPSLGTKGFRACSGAVAANVTDLEQWNESIQLDWWPDPTTKLVTITIGGNDIGFADFARACVLPTSSCDVGTTAYNNTLDKLNNELPSKLEATYRRILQYAPNAKIYVVGYPQVVANKSVNDPADSRCFYMQGGSSNWSEARAARSIVTRLNEKIVNAIATVQAESASNARLRYVDVNASGSPFVGREVCGTASASWFQNIDTATGDPAYVFHPNNLGQKGYATIVGAEINAR